MERTPLQPGRSLFDRWTGGGGGGPEREDFRDLVLVHRETPPNGNRVRVARAGVPGWTGRTAPARGLGCPAYGNVGTCLEVVVVEFLGNQQELGIGLDAQFAGILAETFNVRLHPEPHGHVENHPDYVRDDEYEGPDRNDAQ